MKALSVYVKGKEAGVLAKFGDGTYEFRYAPSYRLDESVQSVAFTIPKSRSVHRSSVLFPFFYGLLAEGVQKRLQCRGLKIDERDHFTRLAETCRQGVIGAVYVLPRKSYERVEKVEKVERVERVKEK